MHQEVQDLRGFLRAVRRYWILVGLLACLGLGGGVLYTALHPPMLASKALVLFPAGGKSIPGEPHRSIDDQVVIASSDGVLLGALRSIEPRVSLAELRARVTASDLTTATSWRCRDGRHPGPGRGNGECDCGQLPHVRPQPRQPRRSAAGPGDHG